MPKRNIVLASILSFLFLFSMSVSSRALARSSYTTEVENLINQERQKAGLQPLAISIKLEQASENHNNIMFSCTKQHDLDSCFTHTVSLMDESDLMTRIKQLGYNPTYVAENIAWGYKTPADVVDGWMNSSGHKANILSTSAKDIGCSSLDGMNGNYQGMYWTCDFGKSTSSSSSPSTSPSPTKVSTPTPTATPRPTLLPSPTPTKVKTTPTIRATRTPTPKPSMKAPHCTIISHKIVCH